jgi:hypothetical protein
MGLKTTVELTRYLDLLKRFAVLLPVALLR